MTHATMKTKIAFGIMLAFGFHLLAEDLTTLDNKTFKDFRVLHTNAFAIRITYSGGGGWINFTNLSPELQKRYGYDAAQAEALIKKQEKIKQLGRLGAVYRLSELAQAQAEAKQEKKPIAFLATEAACLQSNDQMLGKGSDSATIHAFEALKHTTVIVFSDCRTENHQEPPIVDAALHPPEDVHYTPPKVVITDVDLTKVIHVIPYTPNPQSRQKVMAEALQKIAAERKTTSQP